MMKIINVERILLQRMTRKIIKYSIFKISVSDDLTTFFKLKKGNIIDLEFRDFIFFINLKQEMKKSNSFSDQRIGL